MIEKQNRTCWNCKHYHKPDEYGVNCNEGGDTEIGDPDKIMSLEDCNAWEQRNAQKWRKNKMKEIKRIMSLEDCNAWEQRNAQKWRKNKMKEIKRMLEDDETSFKEFYDFLRDKDIGEWDEVNSEEIIKEYISEMMRQGIRVSHILEVLENHPSEEELYQIWLGNSMVTPTPINTKQQLIEALDITMDEE